MTVEYRTEMALTGRNTGIPVPEEVLDRLGGGRRPAVAVEVNGYRYASTVGAMGGRFLIPFSSAHRAASGIGGGDALTVRLDLEAAPREVAVPEDLATALRDAGVEDAFARLAPSHRKAHVVSVEGAKAAATRARRVSAVVEKLRA